MNNVDWSKYPQVNVHWSKYAHVKVEWSKYLQTNRLLLTMQWSLIFLGVCLLICRILMRIFQHVLALLCGLFSMSRLHLLDLYKMTGSYSSTRILVKNQNKFHTEY